MFCVIISHYFILLNLENNKLKKQSIVICVLFEMENHQIFFSFGIAKCENNDFIKKN